MATNLTEALNIQQQVVELAEAIRSNDIGAMWVFTDKWASHDHEVVGA
jgi:hypothetical protein